MCVGFHFVSLVCVKVWFTHIKLKVCLCDCSTVLTVWFDRNVCYWGSSSNSYSNYLLQRKEDTLIMAQQQPDMKGGQCKMFSVAAFPLFFLFIKSRTVTVVHRYYVKLQCICAQKNYSVLCTFYSRCYHVFCDPSDSVIWVWIRALLPLQTSVQRSHTVFWWLLPKWANQQLCHQNTNRFYS